jgi:hypothetical protein
MSPMSAEIIAPIALTESIRLLREQKDLLDFDHGEKFPLLSKFATIKRSQARKYPAAKKRR